MKCCICKNEIKKEKLSGWDRGHNALSVKEGRCCNDYNASKVIPTRMKEMGIS